MAQISLAKQKDIDSKVDRIKLQTGLSYPENNLLDIAKALNIDVYEVGFEQLPDASVNGAIEWKEDGNASIFINKDYPPTRKTFTLAHEIGHYILHKSRDKFRLDVFDYSKHTQESLEETEANYFAGSLLVPSVKLTNLLGMTGDLDAIAKYFGVSRPVIETRIKWLIKNQTKN
jgi:Zn-dependent peptidase ImmA (M78 family)